MAIDIVLKLLSQGADKAKADVKSVKGEVAGLGTEATKTTTETDKIGPSLSNAADQGAKLHDTLQNMRNGGLILAGIGAAGLAISNRFTQASIDASTLGATLEAMMAGVDLSSAVGQIQELGTEIANIKGGDDDEIAAAIGEAVASGRVMSLRNYGIVIDAVGQKSITAARNISGQAGAQEALNQILKAAGPSLEAMKNSMSGAALAAHAFDNRFGNIEETIGEGTGVIKAALYNNVLSPLLDIAEANPELLQTGGAVFAIGSAGATGVGGLISMGSQIGLMIISLNAMGITSIASFGAMASSALVAAGSIALILAQIALVAIAVAGLMYLFDKLTHYKEDAALKENMAANKAGQERLLSEGNAKASARGNAPITVDADGTIHGGSRGGAYEAKLRSSPKPAPTVPDTGDLSSYMATLQNAATGNIQAPAMPSMPSLPTVATAMPVNSGGTPWIDTSRPEARAGGSLTIRPKTQVTQNAAGDYVLKILPTDVVIPNDFGRAVGAL